MRSRSLSNYLLQSSARHRSVNDSQKLQGCSLNNAKIFALTFAIRSRPIRVQSHSTKKESTK